MTIVIIVGIGIMAIVGIIAYGPCGGRRCHDVYHGIVLDFGKVKELLEYGRKEERVSRFVRATCPDDSLFFLSLFHSRSLSLALSLSERWIAITYSRWVRMIVCMFICLDSTVVVMLLFFVLRLECEILSFTKARPTRRRSNFIGGLPAREIIRIIVKENWVFLLLGVEVGSRLLHY